MLEFSPEGQVARVGGAVLRVELSLETGVGVVEGVFSDVDVDVALVTGGGGVWGLSSLLRLLGGGGSEWLRGKGGVGGRVASGTSFCFCHCGVEELVAAVADWFWMVKDRWESLRGSSGLRVAVAVGVSGVHQ